ncbi:ROK family protein [Lapillicoccus jejuensis]|uniref:ROK family protein n=1 Tax=Lapillicoccus jejuensis TaxID=402171 RepID=UPI001B874D20|nr:ROK family protein [Lapillicoccus jejuensis]
MPSVPSVRVVAAVDIGGTLTKAALVDEGLLEVTRVSVPTPPDVAHDLGAHVSAVVDRLLVGATAAGRAVEAVGCGVVVPGLVDERAGVGLLSVNLGWRDLPIGDLVGVATGLPTVVGHDVRAGLVAETRLGAARGARHALFVPLGTGIAGALMVDGHVLTGGGWAGELGHVPVDPDGPPCPCGATGCLEVLASASAVSRAYRERTGRPAEAREVAARVEAGEPDAVAVWSVAVSALARAVLATVTITGVDLVLVGGGLAQSGETLLAPLRREIDARRTFQRPPRVVHAALGDRAGCLGAACLAWDAARSAVAVG